MTKLAACLSHRKLRIVFRGSAFLFCALTILAQIQTAPDAPALGPLHFSGSLRTRTEAWDWFEGDANNSYLYQGSLLRISVGQEGRRLDWQVEMAASVLLGLPDDAIAPGAQGQLGAGASYYAANDRSRNAFMVFPKQAFVRFKKENHSLRLGRFEFIDGTEVTPKDQTLAALKRDRIAHRLIGNFGFTHVMRSFDGAQYSYGTPKFNFTFVGARPTRGVFQVDGWGEINSAIFYAAATGQINSRKGAGEWRLFALQSDDWRGEILKTDNRPEILRRSDTHDIRLATFGGHFIHNFVFPHHQVDVLLWGALQTGQWGLLDHRAGAVSVELGWQPQRPVFLRPWIRAGFHHGSGDRDPNDSRHETFFQPFPTARLYARFPFYTLMNIEDGFGALILRPHSRIALRSEIHSLRLASRNDLWYQGAGAFQPWTFGYTGRPSNGQRGMATLYDCALDFSITPNFTLGVYVASAQGKGVPASIYPENPNGHFGFLEANIRF